MIGFLRSVFRSPTARRSDVVNGFLSLGFTPGEAEWAARDLWRACRCGLPTPVWILDLVKERRACEPEAVSPRIGTAS